MPRLALTRYEEPGKNRTVLIVGNIRINVDVVTVNRKGGSVRLLVEAPIEVGIWRSELLGDEPPPAPLANRRPTP